VSVKVSSWVWHDKRTQGINGNELVVLLALADVANDSGMCMYFDAPEDGTQAKLAKKTRVHRATLIRAVEKLVEKGLLEVIQGRQHAPNGYRIMLSQKSQSATPADSQMSHPVTQMSQIDDSDVANGDVTPSINVLNVRDVSSSDAFGDDVKRLCNLLGELVEANGHKVGTIGKQWWAACDRLVRLDGYTPAQIEIIMRWSTSDEFWSANIRSMPKLREKFSTLRAQRNRELERKKPTKTSRAAAVIDMGRRLEEAANQKRVTG
jgi:DNA-binding MarR family transcriptional regulator